MCTPSTVTIDCCPDDPISLTLFATLTAASCADVNGTVITLTYAGLSGGLEKWTGTWVPPHGSCGTVTFHFGVTPSCNVYMWMSNGGGTIWGSSGTPEGTMTCPFASVSHTTVSVGMPLCLERLFPMSPTCTGNITATVTP